MKIDLSHVDWIALLPYILGAVTTILAWVRDKWGLPKQVQKFLADKQAMDIINKAIADAQQQGGLTDTQKWQFAKDEASRALHLLFDEKVPGYLINLAIEFAFSKCLAAGKCG